MHGIEIFYSSILLYYGIYEKGVFKTFEYGYIRNKKDIIYEQKCIKS